MNSNSQLNPSFNAYSSAFFTANFVFFILSLLFYTLSTFASLSDMCRPEKSEDANAIEVIIHFTLLVLLVSSSAMFFVSTDNLNGSKEKYFYDYQLFSNSSLNKLQKIINNTFQLNYAYFNNINELNHILKNYNKSFSSKTSKFKIAYDNLLINQNTSNFFKQYLKRIDQNQNKFISDITSYSNMHKNRFHFIQKSINNTKKLLNNDLNLYQSDVIYPFALFYSSLILLIPIFYGIFFFFKVCFSRALFCMYPLVALIISILWMCTGLYVSKDDYNNIVYHCIDYPIYNNFKSFNISQIKIDLVNPYFLDVYKQYKKDEFYNKNIEIMIDIINSEKNELNKIKNLIEKISIQSNSIDSNISKVYDVYYQKHNANNNNNNNNNMYDICKKLINGSNYFAIASVILFLTLFALFFSVCHRRTELLDHTQIDNSHVTFSNSGNNFETKRKSIEEISYNNCYLSEILYSVICIRNDILQVEDPSFSINDFFVSNRQYGNGYNFFYSLNDAKKCIKDYERLGDYRAIAIIKVSLDVIEISEYEDWFKENDYPEFVLGKNRNALKIGKLVVFYNLDDVEEINFTVEKVSVFN